MEKGKELFITYKGTFNAHPTVTVSFERCVCCGKDTGVLVTTPVDQRDFYVEGVGEVCSICFREIYRK